MIRHYEGELGVFDYDDRLYAIGNIKDEDLDGWYEKKDIEYLCYIGNDGKAKSKDLISLELPKGCINTRFMFHDMCFDGNICFENFDTSGVEDMTAMFFDCVLNGNSISLGNKFNTSKVKSMENMFARIVPLHNEEDIHLKLGSSFDTSNVENMEGMFWHSFISMADLSNRLNTSNCRNMRNMFSACVFPENFTFGDNFDTRNVEDMMFMFEGCKFPYNFTLGDKFSTCNVKNMVCMFNDCEMHSNFYLGNNFVPPDNKTVLVEMWGKKYDSTYYMFSDSSYQGKNIYEYFNLKENDNIGVIKALTGKNEKELKECQTALLNLLKEGKSIKEAEKILSQSNSFPSDIISGSIKAVSVALSTRCNARIKDLFSEPDSSETHLSSYTVGEIRKKLLSEGYTEDIVNKCIVDYLEDECLVY